ncbi:mevalonate kinase [Carnobacterium viridans]|uniref:Mevalonate kinase n=1 Tax=Carnobacterium viridans TaxID=174587 RepID=A0A1H0Z0P5_9LACT|nr:mevalonate kinase [Carnobacterium viridans]UDE94865.1 mevalonate kinase [Carnobacterium viridans]SDQ20721.1 mevalonate kinase [Carnobacterium viridans]
MLNLNQPALGKANGKIILMGEHSVVYGEPAIAIPFPATHIHATITPIEGPVQLDCVYYQGDLASAPQHLENLIAVVESTLNELKQEFNNFKLTIESTIPVERGMGSSAAVAIATVRAVFNYYSVPLTDDKLLTLANISETIAHGNPSGLDAAMTSGRHPLYYIKGKPFVPFKVSLSAYLIVADTGLKGQTRDAVASIAQLNKEDTETTMDAIHGLGDLARQAKFAIESANPVTLGLVMNEAHETLSSLGVSNERLNHLVSTARTNGALGAKLTGGGRGGCMIALAADKDTAASISNALVDAGAVNTWTHQLGDESVE